MDLFFGDRILDTKILMTAGGTNETSFTQSSLTLLHLSHWEHPISNTIIQSVHMLRHLSTNVDTYYRRAICL